MGSGDARTRSWSRHEVAASGVGAMSEIMASQTEKACDGKRGRGELMARGWLTDGYMQHGGWLVAT